MGSQKMQRWQSVCNDCGKTGVQENKTAESGPPYKDPTVHGSCPKSPNGKHQNKSWQPI